MDTQFCVHYKGDGYPPSNRYCRVCPDSKRACDAVWSRVVALSRSNNGNPVNVPGTRAEMYPNPKNENIVHLKINCRWGLGKEDFLYFLATGHAGMGRKNQRDDPTASPSMTRQEPYVQSVVEMIGGDECEEIQRVRRVQKGIE